MYVLLRILIKNLYSYIHSYMLNYIVAALMLYIVRTYMQLLTYVHSCIVPFHVCDRMAAESIQAALGMNTTQLNLNLPQDPAATVYKYHTEQIYLTDLPNNFCFALLFIVVVEYILLNFKLQLTANLSFVSFSGANGKKILTGNKRMHLGFVISWIGYKGLRESWYGTQPT